MSDEDQKGNLVVGEGVVISGSISVPETATVAGQVEGEVSAKELFVTDSGVIRGKVIAEVIDLRGEVHDTMTASKSLFVRATGKALGTVEYALIEIEKGGDLQGALSKFEDKRKPDNLTALPIAQPSNSKLIEE
jgi:cytoskeletal protein CcmA (bactofilin family)